MMMKSTGISSSSRHLLLLLSLLSILILHDGRVLAEEDTNEEPSTLIQGGIRIDCTNGTCIFDANCEDINPTTVPGTLVVDEFGNNYTYIDITGEVTLQPPTFCQAECTGCRGIPGSDTFGDCQGSAGYVYCPETDECIRPWEDNCPFEGANFIGPVDIICASGSRCNDLSIECDIQIGSFTIGGLYLDNLVGTYSLPEGCTATCEGCNCEGCPPDGNNNVGGGGPTNDTSSEPVADNSGGAVPINNNIVWRISMFLFAGLWLLL